MPQIPLNHMHLPMRHMHGELTVQVSLFTAPMPHLVLRIFATIIGHPLNTEPPTWNMDHASARRVFGEWHWIYYSQCLKEDPRRKYPHCLND